MVAAAVTVVTGFAELRCRNKGHEAGNSGARIFFV
jgi:hypothetical protein